MPVTDNFCLFGANNEKLAIRTGLRRRTQKGFGPLGPEMLFTEIPETAEGAFFR